jgi:hypothetical protein
MDLASRRELTAGASDPNGELSTPEDERSPVVERLRAVLTVLNRFVAENGKDSGFQNFAVIMEALTDEVIEELNEKDEQTIGFFMSQMGEVIAWIGHGDNSRLPDQLRPFVDEIQPPIQVELVES